MQIDDTEVSIRLDDVVLQGTLHAPRDADGAVVFAHGSGSSRFSSRNRSVAQRLHEAGIATLLFDLLTEDEEERERYTRHLRFDIELLAGRLVGVTRWLRDAGTLTGLPLGYFGASTGAAAALVAAARMPVTAVVSRGGRPDLAGDALERVVAPTLLIVGSEDTVVIDLNRQAYARLAGPKALEIVPGASHLFEEPGTLDAAARLAAQWFRRHFDAVARDAAATAPIQEATRHDLSRPSPRRS